MNIPFTASNGIPVHLTTDASNVPVLTTLTKEFAHPFISARGDDVQALREFFQAEADERVGRWRDPEDAVFVVYSGGAWDGVYSPIRVVAERNGASWLLDREDHEPNVPATVLAVARRYFDAHPEPKPWHDAAEGEVWILMFANSSHAWFVNGDYFQSTKTLTNIAKTDEGIIAGRCIFPEEVPS
ncbi:hypothetical protein P2P98_13125 [Microbacterium sp. Kw_RZR3]|uniref:hypothetical protein n=1 Tax=Microbacterium sp. Kw_RZR3 TaxID=3032903 RepID=UPI0023DC10D0|nr:hypothetical protein [Microbacterium sp. Kw_RZR3]MDF2047103.1 hypothetical protein [Microbacterium sp. Kw_RZR3]